MTSSHKKEQLKPISSEKMAVADAISDCEESLAFRITAVYGNIMQFSHQNNQIVGEKNDYYITLEQLEKFLLAMPKSF